MTPIFDDPLLFSLILIPKGKELNSNNYCLDTHMMKSLFEVFRMHINSFSCFKGKYKTLLTKFFQKPEKTVRYVRGLIILSVFLDWIDDPDDKFDNLSLFLSCILPLRFYFFNELANFSFLFKGIFFAITKYLKTINHPQESYIELLQTMYEVNQREVIGLDAIDFVIPSISKVLLENSQSQNTRPRYPHLLTQEDFNTIYPQTQTYNEISLYIRRDYIIQDTMTQLKKILNNRGNLKDRKLSIEFVGEFGKDLGGLFREFITLFIKEAFNEDFGNFVKTEKGQYWFNFLSDEDPEFFKYVGIIAGFAYTARIPIGVSFSSLVYKKLFNKTLELEDLKDLEPSVYNSLTSIREMAKRGEDIRDLDLVFTVSVNIGGEIKDLNLTQGGCNIQVDNDNYEYYIHLYTNYLINERVEVMFNAFKEGLCETCNVDFNSDKISPQLFKFMLEGKNGISWKNFKGSIKYTGWASHYETINHFWEIFEKWNEEQKRTFLKFVTGMSCEPLDGFQSLNINFVKGSDTKLLPTAHTCVNQFVLPDYRNYNTLKQSLDCILANAEGFGII